MNVALATEVQLEGGLLLNKATDVGVGDENSCAINNKQVYCWGVNGSGQVGDGTTTNWRVATRVMVDATTPLGAATQLGSAGIMRVHSLASRSIVGVKITMVSLVMAIRAHKVCMPSLRNILQVMFNSPV